MEKPAENNFAPTALGISAVTRRRWQMFSKG
jgi:hypothetical protein